MRTALLPFLLPIFLSPGSAALAQQTEPHKGPEPVAEIMHGVLQGYLAQEDYPDSLALLPPPPVTGSKAEATDQAISNRLLTLHDGDRFRLAAVDNDLSFPNAAGTFSCALGIRVTHRFDAMLADGLLDEVAALAPRLGTTARQAVGYKELLGVLGLSQLEQDRE